MKIRFSCRVFKIEKQHCLFPDQGGVVPVCTIHPQNLHLVIQQQY